MHGQAEGPIYLLAKFNHLFHASRIITKIISRSRKNRDLFMPEKAT